MDDTLNLSYLLLFCLLLLRFCGAIHRCTVLVAKVLVVVVVDLYVHLWSLVLVTMLQVTVTVTDL